MNKKPKARAPRRAPRYTLGELLVKCRPDTALAESYHVLPQLDAGSRTTLQALDVSRLKVGEFADFGTRIRRFADVKHMGIYLVVSVTELVGEGQ